MSIASCTRVINSFDGTAAIRTTGNGDLIERAGPYRRRYSAQDKATYDEIMVNGVWYVDSVFYDSALSAAGLTASTLQDGE